MTDTAAAPPDVLTRKYFAADEVNFTPGERTFVAWVSVEVVDREGDVVVASGIDYKSEYLANPVVCAVHDYGKWPLGQCEWLKLKSSPQWTGLYGKARIDDDPDAEVVWKKIKSRTVRGVSIGFTPPKDLARGEWGPPTADELKKNPHWAGAKRVIRRCVMIEFSVCPIGMNPAALIEAVSKGLHKPVYSEPVMPEAPETVTPEAEVKTAEAVAPAVTPAPAPEVIAKAAAPADDAGDDGDDDAADDGPVRRGHFVRVTKGPHRGTAGKVVSVHRAGLVPDVEDDVPATKADPGVRLQAYKAMGDGHRETSHHVGCKMAHCERTDDLKPPARRKGLPDPAALPPLVGRTDAQVKAAELERLKRELSPAGVQRLAREAREKAWGAV